MIDYELGRPSWGECMIVFIIAESSLLLIGHAIINFTDPHLFFISMYFTFSVSVGVGIILWYKNFIDESNGRNKT